MRGIKIRQFIQKRLGSTGTDGRKADWSVYGILALLTFGFCALFVMRFGVFGSRVDWVNQHSVFPEYFRQRFYETKDLLPDFTWNLGAGQNIYAISYYGLFSPVILFSYLLPWIPMDLYIMISSIVSYMVSVLLVFHWLRNHHYKTSFAGIMALYFSLSTSLIYQSYNQIMFVNYMPFLCMALIGTDRYLKDRKRGWLLCGTWGMILTSFYFSIGGMLVLCLYALSEYLTKLNTVGNETVASFSKGIVAQEGQSGNRSMNWTAVLFMGVRYVGQLLTAVLLSGILLVPTALVIFGGQRTQAPADQSVGNLIEFNPAKLLYSPYGVGMSILVIVAVIGGIICAKRWTDRVLPVGLFLVFALPVVGALLNGGLYEKPKVFIPFLPLLVLQTARYVQSSTEQKMTFRQIAPWMITLLLLSLLWKEPFIQKYWLYILLELICSGVCFGIAKWLNRAEIAIASAVITLFIIHLSLHPQYNRMLTRKDYDSLHDSQVEQQMNKILDEDQDFYRMESFFDDQKNHNNINRLVSIGQNITSLYSSCYNEKYIKFRKEIFHINEPFRNNMMQSVTDNPCFLQFMGVKYRVTGQNLTGDGETQVVKNDQVAPLWYVTNQVISEEDYTKYSFPESQTMLLQRSVVKTDSVNGQNGNQTSTEIQNLPKMIRQNMDLPEQDLGNISIQAVSKGQYRIHAKENVTISVPTEGQNSNVDLLAISFRIKNRNLHQNPRDIYIRINQQTNKLSDYEYGNHNDTFYYMIPHEANQSLEITFSRGEYELSDWQTYAGCLAALQNRELYQQPVQTDSGRPQGDRLSGKVSCPTDSYLITSIPYDDNFTLIVDGKRQELMCVNTSFVGAKLEAGEHVISLEYHAGGKWIGIWMTVFGLLIWGLSEGIPYILRERKCRIHARS